MSQLSVKPKSSADAGNELIYDSFARRIAATPPGMCPIALQLNLLESSAAQTCGKCVPCRDGLPQLAKLMRRVLDCEAKPSDLETMRVLAQMIADTSDCAIGYEAGELVLHGLDAFADEYESHVKQLACQSGIGQTVPCETGCPAHVNVPGYIALVAAGDSAGAVQMIRKDNPFPTACALICEHPCEKHCRRLLIDDRINIRGIKRYAVDTAPANTVPVPKRLPDSGRHIAVVGGGASGLTCAYFSALMGHKVTVFESHKKLGGMTRYGIPEYRFPRNRLDEDIEAVLSVGNIDVKLSTRVDTAMMKDLAESYDAVYVAIGAQLGKSLRLEGIDADGVMSAVELLGRIGDHDYPDFTGKNVVVIGGGNVAMDCCRTAVRLGAETVSVAYRRRIEDMKAARDEIEAAVAEGVAMLTLQAPVRIEVDESGHSSAVICQPQYISKVSRGRPAPVPASKPERSIPADIVLVAVGQGIDSAPFEQFGMKAERGRFCADEYLHAPGFDNVFVGGDCQGGPKTVIIAIGAGKVAARNIDEYLGYHHKLDCGISAPIARANDRTPCGRVNNDMRLARTRKGDFEQDQLPMSCEEAMQECARCLRCDHFGCGALEDGRVQYV